MRGVLLFVMMSLASLASAQDPEQITSVLHVDWSQMASMLVVLAGISTGVQWLLTKAVIQPQISKAIVDAKDLHQKWAEAQFPSKSEFNIHVLDDKNTLSMIADIVHDQSRDAERLAALHDKMLVMEAKRSGG